MMHLNYKVKKWLLNGVFFYLFLGLYTSAVAQEIDFKKMTLRVNGGYISSYIYRAQKRTKEAWQANIEAMYTFDSPMHLYAGIFSIIPRGKYLQETDLYFGLSKNIDDNLCIDTGVTHYLYTNNKTFISQNYSTEIFGGLYWGAFITPAIYTYYDFSLQQLTTEGSLCNSIDFELSSFSLKNILIVGYLHAKNWKHMLLDRETHYKYITFKEEWVYTFTNRATAGIHLCFTYNDNVLRQANVYSGRHYSLSGGLIFDFDW